MKRGYRTLAAATVLCLTAAGSCRRPAPPAGSERVPGRIPIAAPSLPPRGALPRRGFVLRDRFLKGDQGWRVPSRPGEPAPSPAVSLQAGGGLRFPTTEGAPDLVRETSLAASHATEVTVVAEMDPGADRLWPLRLLWRREGDPGWDPSRSIRQTVWPTRGSPRTMRFRVDEHPLWSGTIVALGLDAIDGPGHAVLHEVDVEDQPLLRRVVEEVREQGYARAGPGSCRRRCVPVLAGEGVVFSMAEPASGGTLELALAVPEALAKPSAAPFAVALVVESAAGRGEVALTLDPASREADGGWREVRLPVEAGAGGTLRATVSLPEEPEGSGRLLLLENVARWIPRVPDAARAPSVLLVTIDTWRADALGAAGTMPLPTRVLDGLAAQGAYVPRCVTAANTTIPSHASILSSLWPRDHGLLMDRGRAAARIPSLADALAARGWETAMAVSTGLLNLRRGAATRWSAVAEGFQVAFECPDYERAAPETNAAVIPWLRRHAEEPFFLWLHYFDAHRPYEPPDRFVAAVDPDWIPLDRIRDEVRAHGLPPRGPRDEEAAVAWLADLFRHYLGEVLLIDESLGEVLAVLREREALERTVVVVVGDHGESIYENGIHGNHSGHYEAVTSVPLILRGPGVPAGRRLEGRAATVDLAPTIRGLLGIPPRPDPPPAGLDLTPVLRGERALPPRDLYTLFGGGGLEGLVRTRGERKEGVYHRRSRTGSGVFAFDLARDPHERTNLAPGDPALAREIEASLARWQAEGRAGGGEERLTPEEEEILRALGYE